MQKRIINICIIGILACCICGCAQSEGASLTAKAAKGISEESIEQPPGIAEAESAQPPQITETESVQPTEIAEEGDEQTVEIPYEMPDWLAAYVDYIEGMESYDSYDKCSFIYVDEDEIPELVINTGIYETGCLILTFYDGEVEVLQTGGLRFRYIERKNLLCDTAGQAGEYENRVYFIENGKWIYIAGGKYVSELENGLHIDKYNFEWEGEKVEEEQYWERLNYIFDEEQAIIPKKYILCDSMLSPIQSGDRIWTPEDEQDAEEERGDVIADFEYSDEYIPISKVDFASYQNELSKEDWQALSSFFPILLEGKTFMVAHCPYPDEYTDDIKEQNINDMYASWGFPEYPDEFVLESFTLCDLTGDGQKELIVYSDFAIGLYCVFHKEGDDFYAVYMPIRWFELLQDNGIYLGSGGAGRSYFNRLHFLRNVFWEEQVGMYDGDYYEIGDEAVNVEKFSVWEDEMMVGEAVWYDARSVKTQD